MARAILFQKIETVGKPYKILGMCKLCKGRFFKEKEYPVKNYCDGCAKKLRYK